MKKLIKSRRNRWIAGVCGGIGEYFNVDPTIIRLMAVLLLFWTKGWFLLLYVALALVIPNKPLTQEEVTNMFFKTGSFSKNTKKPRKDVTPK